MRFLPLLLVLSACTDVENPDGDNVEEVITTVTLIFDGPDGVVEGLFADPENDGSPVIVSPDLAANTEYQLTVEFLNELSDPAEDITEEIADEADEHQVFFMTDATIVYNDQDDGGLPLGLDVTLTTGDVGSTDLTIILRHLPELDGVAQKVAGLAEQAETDGISSLPGDSDISVTVPLTVQ
ncbi:MAG: hypothetical protein ACJAZO_004268 [Myxococcota bacterium]|jgi:hypothetical protein